MTDDPSERFFRWLDAYGIKRTDAAAMLEVDERSLSSYRSRGLPAKKWPLAERLMEESAASSESQAEVNKVQVILSDEQFALIEQAAKIVDTPFKEFLLRACVQKAKEEIARSSITPLTQPIIPLNPLPISNVAEDPSPYGSKSAPRILAAAGSPIFSEVLDWNGPSDTVIVRICGLSMEPLLHDGDEVPMRHKRASRNPFMKKGMIYLVAYDGGYTVKRYNTRPALPEEAGEEWVEKGKVKILESINPAYSEIIIKQPLEWVAWLDR